MKQAIVTGANGFIGSEVVKELINNNISVIALHRPNSFDKIPKSDLVQLVELDINNILKLKDIIKEHKPDVFYHFAWEGVTEPGRSNAEVQLRNIQNTVNCVKVAKELGCKRFICSGSIMERETIASTYAQESRPGMGYIYGAGKFAAHSISKSIAANIGIEHVWGVVTNTYGVGELSSRFINTTLRKIIKNEPLKFTAATQNYDFIYITDVAKAFYLIGEKGLPFCEYIIGSGDAKPLRKFIEELQEELCPNEDLYFGDIPFTGENIPLSSFDTSELIKDTGFIPNISFSEGVRKTMDWLKSIDDNKL
ncbi:NAD-dependent epimerase/dehydratase family protein [Clostridium sp. OS1-26]|uniref:NAD-dependent epimerase/dehydratase family protein n=1 Tax=Clostridium sp. OS1-26 TaxID=3070681 RepID=UPI0027DF45BD|nr:NAD-dependent epimerase/dehydratase family protein [Clostridium sp. OS1-26]WML36763.1 NAD-dependent epimerase/dehydratase family protein [Clostridium sp. OS1-26]